jgi:MYXO-CTERM domain-containing protein
VSARLKLSDPGEYQFRAGERTVTVAVVNETSAETATTTNGQTADAGGESGPGFGVLAAVLALALLLAHRRE